MALTTGGAGRTTLSEINVTPLVDVMLVLLIVFMVTAPLLTTGLRIDLPEVKAASARIDKLLEEGRLELKTEERKKLYLDFQRFLNEDAPAAFLYHPISYTVSRK